MKPVIRTIMMAVSLLVLSAILVYQHSQLVLTKQTVKAQQDALSDLQGEFKEQDLSLLDGETVSAAEAVSLVRKYRNKVTITKNGLVVDPSVAGNRSVFAENTNWVVTVKIDANGVCTGLEFMSPLGFTGEPSTVADAKSSLASIVGGHSTDSWSSLMSKVTEYAKTEQYRKEIATLLGLGQSNSWTAIMSEINKRYNSAGSVSTAMCEQVTVANSGTGNFTLSTPTLCYYKYGEYVGFAYLENGTYQYLTNGDDSSSMISINLADKTIKNYGESAVSCTLFSF